MSGKTKLGIVLGLALIIVQFGVSNTKIVQDSVMDVMNDLLNSVDKEKSFEEAAQTWLREVFPTGAETKTEQNLKPEGSETPEQVEAARPIVKKLEALFDQFEAQPGAVIDLIIDAVGENPFFHLPKKQLMVAKQGLRFFTITEYFKIGLKQVKDVVLRSANTASGQLSLQFLAQILRGYDHDTFASFISRTSITHFTNQMKVLREPENLQMILPPMARALIWIPNVVRSNENSLMMFNMMLASQGFPPIDPNNLIKSSIKVVETIFQEEHGYSYVSQGVDEAIEHFEKEYASSKEFKSMTEQQQEVILAKFLEASMPVWLDFFQLLGHFQIVETCAPHLLCSFTAHYSNNTNTVSRLWMKNFSNAFMEEFRTHLPDVYETFAECLTDGASKQDQAFCDEKYEKYEYSDDCKVFEWQKPKSNEHEEL